MQPDLDFTPSPSGLIPTPMDAPLDRPVVPPIAAQRSELEPLTIAKVAPAEVTQKLIEELAGIYARCFSAPPWNENWPREAAEATCRAYLTDTTDVLVARRGTEITGLIVGVPLELYHEGVAIRAASKLASSANTTLYYLADFAVDPKLQGAGIGQELLLALIAFGGRAGFEVMITRTRSDNDRALKVFNACDFKECGSSEATTGGVMSLRIILERRLDVSNAPLAT